jgi:hypothetical protein
MAEVPTEISMKKNAGCQWGRNGRIKGGKMAANIEEDGKKEFIVSVARQAKTNSRTRLRIK